MNSSCLSRSSISKIFPTRFEQRASRYDQALLLLFLCSVWVVVAADSSASIGPPGFYSALVSALIIAYVAASADASGFGGRTINPNLASTNVKPAIEDKVEKQERLFRSIFDHSAGMALVGLDGSWVTTNRSFCESVGYSNEELLERPFHEIVHPDDIGTILVQTKKLLEGSISSYQTEQRFHHKLGHMVWMLLSVSVLRNPQESPSQLIFQFQEITGRKLEEERLVHHVFHDALTGLPNRALFMDRLRQATERARRKKDYLFAVLFLDLDCFKKINDSLGHIMGDQLLIQVARRLKTCLRTTDTIARLGGDEFTILLEDLSDHREATRIVQRLQEELARYIKLGTTEVAITASIGIATSTVAYERAEEVLRDADTAMYRAKSAGRACYKIFDKDQQIAPLIESNLESDLDKAIENGELVLHYQPIVSLETGRLLAFEALVRWQHPQCGLISPMDFIPIAENTGAIVSIGRWVLREACRQLKQWHKKYPLHESVAVTVNLSSKQFVQSDLIDQVIEVLQDTGLDPRSLKLEITESVVIENIATATVMLQQLRALGIELGIDDFGTGYSSLTYLHRLPINSLKIDKSFVKGMVENRDKAEIVKTILALARSLGINVVAEGVETLEQFIELRRLQCDAGQGFLFSKPADAEAAENLLDIRTQWKATIASLVSGPETQSVVRKFPSHGVSPRPDRRALLRVV